MHTEAEKNELASFLEFSLLCYSCCYYEPYPVHSTQKRKTLDKGNLWFGGKILSSEVGNRQNGRHGRWKGNELRNIII